MNRHLKYGEAGHVVQWQKTFLACKKSWVWFLSNTHTPMHTCTHAHSELEN
jgi:hypothetical protein